MSFLNDSKLESTSNDYSSNKKIQMYITSIQLTVECVQMGKNRHHPLDSVETERLKPTNLFRPFRVQWLNKAHYSYMMAWFLECLEGKINIKSVMNHGGMTGIVRQTRMTKWRQSTMAKIKINRKSSLHGNWSTTVDTFGKQLDGRWYGSISRALYIITVGNYSFSKEHEWM